MGAKAVKMKVGAVPIREDVERVKAVREAIGPDVKPAGRRQLRLPRYEAIQIAKRMEEYDIFWFEEPVAPDDYEGHKRLAAHDDDPDRDRRERVHPLRLPRPDRDRRRRRS